jgi:hypothetical protein
VLACGFDQGITKELVIGVRGKYDLPVVAALDDVLGLTRNDAAGKAGHGLSPRQSGIALEFSALIVSDPVCTLQI